jgi:pyruvate ferredoxin oxidoreductase gamma subunit
MFEVRFHGRGGQGAVMAAQTLAEAAVLEGYHAQAFPYFGAERRGAPVKAFARIDKSRIVLKSQIYHPDMLVLLDEMLPEIEQVAEGLKPEGVAVVNTPLAPEEYDLGISVLTTTVDATSIALEKLKAPIVNTSILGAMARAQDLISLNSIVKAIHDKFGEKLGARAANRCKADRPIVPKLQWLPDWDQMPIGVALPIMESNGVALGPGSSWQNPVGTWRTSSPHYDIDKCIRCLRCWWSCPEGTIKRQEDDHMKFDYRWCKGCGICAQICPASAIDMVRGVKVW